jgi:hypothetical protein
MTSHITTIFASCNFATFCLQILEELHSHLQLMGSNSLAITERDIMLSNHSSRMSKLGFTDLPPELRIKVYRNLFVVERVPLVGPYPKLSSQLLRCSKKCLAEGRPIMYKETPSIPAGRVLYHYLLPYLRAPDPITMLSNI